MMDYNTPDIDNIFSEGTEPTLLRVVADQIIEDYVTLDEVGFVAKWSLMFPGSVPGVDNQTPKEFVRLKYQEVH